MAFAVKVMAADGEELREPYLLRLGGWTEERYFAEAPESQIVEFEDGELIMPSPVNIRHQDIVGLLTFLLRGYMGSKRLGRVFNGPGVVRLRPGLDYEPDIFVVAREQLGQLAEQYFAGAPILVVEVISPGGRNYDLRTKAANYRQHGVREYWAIDPDAQTLSQHTLPTADAAPYVVQERTTGRVESYAVPRFWIEVAWLWDSPLPEEMPLLDRLLR